VNNIKIAIQKSGRLSEKSFNLLEECGISFGGNHRKLISNATNFPIEILFLRDDDIPEYIRDGVADAGIVGENEYLESKMPLSIVKRLGFSKCRLSLAIPKNHEYQGIKYFQGKRIATSYPNILKNYLDQHNIDSEIHKISGSVEISPGIGLADAIFDIISTGSTLISNGLKEVELVMKSEAVLIAPGNMENDKKDVLDKLLFRINSVLEAKNYKYILLNAPNDRLDNIIELIPGMKSPTTVPLAQEGWSSVHSVVNINEFWQVIDKLKAFGAKGILVVPIENMIR
jgi:ATP phosphoribosyltransferase